MTVPVLGMLAARSWFRAHGEVALTGGLAHCLEGDSAVGTALLNLMRERTGVAETGPVTWVAEEKVEDGRVDIAAVLAATGEPDGGVLPATGAPVVRIEGKVSAPFAKRQVSVYIEDQLKKLAAHGASAGVLAVVVPESRVAKVRRDVQAELAAGDATPTDDPWLIGKDPSVSVCVASWDDVFYAALTAAPGNDDVRQLLAACRVLDGADVPALTEDDLAGQWVRRTADIDKIVLRVTELACLTLAPGLKLLPERAGDPFAGPFRYLGPDSGPLFAVGRRAGNEQHPVWAAWKPAAASSGMDEQLRRANWPAERDTAGYLWVPLAIEPLAAHKPATRQIVAMAMQAVELWRIGRSVSTGLDLRADLGVPTTSE